MKRFNKIFLVLIFSLILISCSKNENVNNEELENTQKSIKSSEVSTFVKYDDNIYYWKLNKDSREKTGLYANYTDSINIKNNLVKVDLSGKEEVVYHGIGSKELVISNDKIYTSSTSDEYENNRNIYSIDLSGNNKKDIGIGIMKYIYENTIVGLVDKYSGGIFIIDTLTDEYKIIQDKVKLLAMSDDTIYYSDNSDNKLVIGKIKNNESKEIMTIKTTDFKYEVTSLEVEHIDILKDKIEIYVGYRDGSAALLQELIKYTANRDGSNVSSTVLDVLDNSIINNKKIYIDDDNIMYQKDSTVNKIISLSDLSKKYKLNNNEDILFNIYASSILDNDIYFILDYGTHDSSSDIGWRYSYKRIKTLYLKYNISSSSINNIYEF